MRSLLSCKQCGEKEYSTAYYPCETKAMMDAEGVCFICAFWMVKIKEGCPTVIDGHTYSPGNKTDRDCKADYRGMAGRRFDIEYFDGRKITTFDLWSGGPIPDRFRSQIPDTAKFISGSREPLGADGYCWNPASTTNPPYPLPNGTTYNPKEK